MALIIKNVVISEAPPVGNPGTLWIKYIQDDNSYQIYLPVGNGWQESNIVLSSKEVSDALGYTPENNSNKVITLTAQSTNTQYPSAKAVYDAIQSATPSSEKHILRILDTGENLSFSEAGQLLTLDNVPITEYRQLQNIDMTNTVVEYYNFRFMAITAKADDEADGWFCTGGTAVNVMLPGGVPDPSFFEIRMGSTSYIRVKPGGDVSVPFVRISESSMAAIINGTYSSGNPVTSAQCAAALDTNEATLSALVDGKIYHICVCGDSYGDEAGYPYVLRYSYYGTESNGDFGWRDVAFSPPGSQSPTIQINRSASGDYTINYFNN